MGDYVSEIYLWDGFTDFQAPHRKLFDFNTHRWTDDFLRLAGQPLLCFGIEWSGSRSHGGWGAQYHLAYWGKETQTQRFPDVEKCPICQQTAGYYHTHEVEVGENKILFKERSDVATLRKELANFLKGIQVDHVGTDFVIDQPPVDYDKIRAYYDRADKRLHFKDEDTLKRFIAYAWGPDKINLIGKKAQTKPLTKEQEKATTRLKALKEELE